MLKKSKVHLFIFLIPLVVAVFFINGIPAIPCIPEKNIDSTLFKETYKRSGTIPTGRGTIPPQLLNIPLSDIRKNLNNKELLDALTEKLISQNEKFHMNFHFTDFKVKPGQVEIFLNMIDAINRENSFFEAGTPFSREEFVICLAFNCF